MKAFISLLLGGATLTTVWTAPAQAAWFTDYECGPYTITLREVGQGNVYSFSGEGPTGRLEMQGGQQLPGNNSWRYGFENGDLTYVIEDYWGTGRNQPDSARLEVIQFDEDQMRGRYIVNESCSKIDYGV